MNELPPERRAESGFTQRELYEPQRAGIDGPYRRRCQACMVALVGLTLALALAMVLLALSF